MSFLVLFFIGILQSSSPDSPVTLRCELDTDLPLEKLYVSVEEKREVKAVPQSEGESSSAVTLTDLPEGDLHLLFYLDQSITGRVEVPSAERGELIRLKVRLVEGNAILLNDYRIRGVNGFSSSQPGTKIEPAAPASPTDSPSPPPPPATEIPSPPVAPSQACPPAGEPVTLSGKVVRIIDNDSFELLSGSRSYVVYLGSATRYRGSRERVHSSDLRQNQAVTVRGTVAAGPEGECSIGAREIQLKT